MNVIYGKDNLALIADKYTALELETMDYDIDEDPIVHYAIVGPDDLSLENLVKLKQMIPVHEALIKNYKEKNWDFCLAAIGKLVGNIDPFMDTFYEILKGRIKKQMENPSEEWTHVLDITNISEKA